MNGDMAPGALRWISVTDAAVLGQVAYQRILDVAAQAIKQRGRFLLVLAGGSTPLAVYQMLRTATADWPNWQIYFGDERCLPADDAERNSRMAAEAWLDHVAIPPEQIHRIPAELGATAAARAYAQTLQGLGDFDLVLLGLGEDGHTASLFPGQDWGLAATAADVLAVFDAPKRPAQRVSLSAARLSRAREVLFLAAGAAKREAIHLWRTGAPLPATAIKPAAGVDVLVESALLG